MHSSRRKWRRTTTAGPDCKWLSNHVQMKESPGRGCANSWNMKERSTAACSFGHWKMLATTCKDIQALCCARYRLHHEGLVPDRPTREPSWRPTPAMLHVLGIQVHFLTADAFIRAPETAGGCLRRGARAPPGRPPAEWSPCPAASAAPASPVTTTHSASSTKMCAVSGGEWTTVIESYLGSCTSELNVEGWQARGLRNFGWTLIKGCASLPIRYPRAFSEAVSALTSPTISMPPAQATHKMEVAPTPAARCRCAEAMIKEADSICSLKLHF